MDRGLLKVLSTSKLRTERTEELSAECWRLSSWLSSSVVCTFKYCSSEEFQRFE